MALAKLIQTVTLEATPASATTAAGTVLRGLMTYEVVSFDFTVVGGTGGTLDVYLQRAVDEAQTVWRDFLHLPQVAAATTKYYSVTCALSNSILEVGNNTSPALAANTMVGGHPGQACRLLYVAGAGTSVAGSVTLYTFGWNGLK